MAFNQRLIVVQIPINAGKKGSEKREVLLISFSISARFVFAIIDGFTDLIKEKDEGQVTFGKSDKHLEFQVLLQCDIPDAPTQCQSIRITTVVKYHNSLGKVYFFFIRPFHALICKWLLKRAARNWEKESTNIVK